jgi:nicotinate-nucleotide pyrophosphorylase (carboxylating)
MRLNEGVKQVIKAALCEDISTKDITTAFAFPQGVYKEAVIISKESGVLCGIDVIAYIFGETNKKVIFKALKKDGSICRKNDKVAFIKGDIRAILTCERVALNFLSRLSGIATYTAEFVEKVGGLGVKILDTRKTTPVLRALEKYAVKTGGGYNHRMNLADGILVKDNHLRAGSFISRGRLDEVKFEKLIERIRKMSALKIEIEVESLPELRAVAKYRPDIVMLDNFPVKQLKEAVALRNKSFPKILIEASGGVNLGNVKKIARTGVDFISIGSITHSPKAIDFSLEII